jgi:hypothetical protein
MSSLLYCAILHSAVVHLENQKAQGTGLVRKRKVPMPMPNNLSIAILLSVITLAVLVQVRTPCSFGEGSPPWPSDRRVMVTRRVASLMIGAYNFIIFMYHLAYGRQFAHSTAYITSVSSSTPSSTACPVGVQFSPRKRGGSALRSSTTTYCGMLFWSRVHRSTMAVCIPSVAQLPR